MKTKRNREKITEMIAFGKFQAKDKEELIHSLLREKTPDPVPEIGRLSAGQRVADKMAAVAGSWPFIIGFCLFLACWICLNAILAARAFDQYPFILLNLALSCLAAIQAPIIMMSQNRQGEKDRRQAESDYQVNLKSEIILEDLHQKMDDILRNQETIMQKFNREADG